MSEEQKDTQQEKAPAEESPQAGTNNNNHLAEKRGRMIASAMLAAVVLSLIALVVAGIFNWTAAYLTICPKDLSVNDPAPVLWMELEAKSTKAQPLGVPKNLISTASFKTLPGEAKAPGVKDKHNRK